MLGDHTSALSRLGRSVPPLLALCALIGACDKKVLRENVRLPMGAANPSPGMNLDAGVIVDEPDAACGDDAGLGEPEADLSVSVDDGPTEFSKTNLLTAVGKCALASFRAFDQRAKALEQATTRWADEPTDCNASAARAAFRAAMESFQRAELFRIGPAAGPGDP